MESTTPSASLRCGRDSRKVQGSAWALHLPYVAGQARIENRADAIAAVNRSRGNTLHRPLASCSACSKASRVSPLARAASKCSGKLNKILSSLSQAINTASVPRAASASRDASKRESGMSPPVQRTACIAVRTANAPP
eukprot:scaffold171947_cov28-Tisochrysis_lutea.AAC.3